MFSKTCLDELEALIGYDLHIRWLAAAVYGRQRDRYSSITIMFSEDSPRVNMRVYAEENLAAQRNAGFIAQLAPLLFVTSYRAIDLLFEWLMRANNGHLGNNVRFEEKIATLGKSISTHKLPVGLSESTARGLYSIYQNNVKYRNALTHGAWGTVNENGDLHFSFTHSKRAYNKTVSLQEILDLAELVSITGRAILSANQADFSCDYLMDRVASLRGVRPRGLNQYVCKAVYRTKRARAEQIVVPVAKLREDVHRACGANLFHLTVEALDATWEIPAECVSHYQEIQLLDEWSCYITSSAAPPA